MEFSSKRGGPAEFSSKRGGDLAEFSSKKGGGVQPLTWEQFVLQINSKKGSGPPPGSAPGLV